MRRFILALLAAFLAVAASPLSGHESTDALRRPLLWGDRVGDKRLSLCMPCTRLRYGQPVVVFLRSTNDSREASYLRIRWDGDPPTTRLELRSSSGAGTSTTPQVCGFASGESGYSAAVRVVPRGTTALGRHFRPGRYRLAVVYRKQADPGDPKAWIGELRSNEIEFEVVDAKLRDGVQWVPEQLRTWAAAQIARLGHGNPEARREAETGLFNAAREPGGSTLIPILERATVANANTQVAKAASRILRRLLFPLTQPSAAPCGWDPYADGPYLACLGEVSWGLLGEMASPDTLKLMRLKAAICAPLPPYTDLTKPSAEQVGALTASLAHTDYALRLRAVRSISSTGDPQLIRALVARLADSFHYFPPRQMGMPLPDYPVADEAAEAIRVQGTAAVGPLVALCRSEPEQRVLRRAVALLGELGPDPRTLTYLREQMGSPEYDRRYMALGALSKLGPPAVPDLAKTARNQQEHRNIRRDAIEALGAHAMGDEVRAIVLDALRDEAYEVVGAAAQTAARLQIAAALPELMRVARDENINQNARYAAMAAVTALAERKAAAQLLMDLTDARCHNGVRGRAVQMLAGIGWRAAIPRALDALEDQDWFVRATADTALRGFAVKPEGVGYNSHATSAAARKAESAKWRARFKQFPEHSR